MIKSKYAYIDSCGRLVYNDAGLLLQITGTGPDGWQLRFRK